MEELHFSVGPVDWTVKLVDDIPQIDGTHVWGCCEFIPCKISISALASSKQRFITMLHELNHAWYRGFGPRDHSEECMAEWIAMVNATIVFQCLEQIPALERLLGCPIAQMRRQVEANRL